MRKSTQTFRLDNLNPYPYLCSNNRQNSIVFQYSLIFHIIFKLLRLWMNSKNVTIQMKATGQCCCCSFFVVVVAVVFFVFVLCYLFIMLGKVVLTFEFVDEIYSVTFKIKSY